MRSCMRNKLLVVASVGLALALLLHPQSSQAAGLLIADGGFGGVLEIKEQQVQVTINNGVAVTEVEQVFLNTENRIVEALYTFPVPKAASVANFSMWIGGKEMIGEVVEKERARQIYESYKQTRRDPGLLEQVDYKRFEMRIFPIPAGAEQRVKVTYYQELDFDHDWATYVYPLATVANGNTSTRTDGTFSVSMHVKSEVPLVEMESPSHRDDFVIVKHSPNYFQASLEQREGNLNRDVVIAFKSERARTGIDVISSKTNGDDGYFLLTLTPGKELEEMNKGADYVFVLDVSGSMANDGKLRLSRGSTSAFIDALGEGDRFEVITFNVAANTMFNQLTEVKDESRQAARTFLEGQQARGGTVLRPAITAAYRYQDADRPLNVVVLSDGMTEQKEQQELLALIQQRPAGSRVFCIGVGNEVNRPLLQQLADRAGGLAAFLSQDDSFERQAQAFRRKLVRPAATNVKLSFAGVDVYDVEPQQIPNLYHGSPIRVFGRYKQGGTVKVGVQADVLGAPLDQTVELELPQQEPNNPEIERMWAFHRVERLMADDRTSGASSTNKDEIVRLCEGYSIVSEYASFIVLENDAEYQRWSIQRRNATRVERDRNAQLALRRQLDELRDRAVAQLGPDRQQSAPGTELAAATPSSGPSPNVPSSQPSIAPPVSTSPNSRDLNMPSFGGGGGGAGGGAVDPITGAIAIALAAAAGYATRRKQRAA